MQEMSQNKTISDFDLGHWEDIKHKLKAIYPQLTDADLVWRHETKEALFSLIARKLEMSKLQFTTIVDLL